ncbi:pentatricopeptide repeat-containing protein [Tripterygium wilfordii]|uniref:Pentatricopeptide repeat-containing protein n=1 Tax=Tripterygium wilfordii TaxID=458696 RepID=A0A7J7D611_TRIWF|nr:pentatricopeptide repeat-containing protein At2g35030, mitochondrial-like [Tripterygium wilfordii]KAF5741753.1 pentatricopeptide repeat-containing protein [Tripterygium wilfordii]
MIRCLLPQFRYLSTVSRSTSPNDLFQCNKTISRLAKLGQVKEARQLFDSMPQRDTVSWNSMISAYTQNGQLRNAKLLFDAFEGKNIRTWTILLSGYAEYGQIKEANMVFQLMPERNVVSWNAMINGYVQNGEIRQARKLFDKMPVKNVASWNAVITGYCGCGMMREARELFDRMPERSNPTWMIMIKGYVEIGRDQEGWGIFLMLTRCGVELDQAVLVAGFSAVMGSNDLKLVGCLRTKAMKVGLEGDVVVGTAAMNTYMRCGSLGDAVKFFETMPERNEYSWTSTIAAFSQCGRLDDAIALYQRNTEKGVDSSNTMLTAYAECGRIDDARHIFDEIVKPSILTWNSMVNAYAQNGMLEDAKDMFIQMPQRNAISWATMISGFVHNGQCSEGLRLFSEFHRTGMLPSHSSFTTALHACSFTGDVNRGRQIHTLTIKARCQFNSYVGNGLISMYAKGNSLEDVSRVFRTMRVRDIVSWNSLVAGLSKNYMLDDAQSVFENMPERDVVTWTAIISAHVQAGKGEKAFELFLDMLTQGMKPRELTLISLLTASGNMCINKSGEQFHALVVKHGFESCRCVCNAVMTMYFKCGNLDGLRVFEEMPDQDIVTWNAVLSGYAKNGLSKEAIRIFEQMKAASIFPDEISFLQVMTACCRTGLVNEVWAYFNSMINDYGISPSVEHYTCIVDLLGRAGHISEAESLIKNMPVKADCLIWETLLTACRIHGNVGVGQRVAERLVKMGTQTFGTYVLLSNIYASQGLWKKVEETKELMNKRGVTKDAGISSIQVKNKLHSFLLGGETQ